MFRDAHSGGKTWKERKEVITIQSGQWLLWGPGADVPGRGPREGM